MFVAEDRLLRGLDEENTVRNRDTGLRLIEISQDILYLYDSENSRRVLHETQDKNKMTEQEHTDANENNNVLGYLLASTPLIYCRPCVSSRIRGISL